MTTRNSASYLPSSRGSPSSATVITVTTALKRAFDVASRLPDAEQDALAAAILEEIAVDRRWESTLTASGDALDRLADEALAEHAAGRTEPLDPEKL